MSASVSCSVSVRNESSSDGSDALGTNFCKGGQLEDHTVLLQWHVQVVSQFLLLYQRNAITII